MNRIGRLASLTLTLAAFGVLQGQDLPAPLQARFVALLCKSTSSPNKLHVKDAALIAELGKLGVQPDDAAVVAWGGSEGEVKSLKAAKKMVICGKLAFLPAGASVAIVEEGGKPQIYLHMGNISASGVTLSDSILKVGKRL